MSTHICRAALGLGWHSQWQAQLLGPGSALEPSSECKSRSEASVLTEREFAGLCAQAACCNTVQDNIC